MAPNKCSLNIFTLDGIKAGIVIHTERGRIYYFHIPHLWLLSTLARLRPGVNERGDDIGFMFISMQYSIFFRVGGHKLAWLLLGSAESWFSMYGLSHTCKWLNLLYEPQFPHLYQCTHPDHSPSVFLTSIKRTLRYPVVWTKTVASSFPSTVHTHPSAHPAGFTSTRHH